MRYRVDFDRVEFDTIVVDAVSEEQAAMQVEMATRGHRIEILGVYPEEEETEE